MTVPANNSSLDKFMSIIRQYPLFHLLTDEDMYALAKLGQEKFIEADEKITQEGSNVDCIYLIINGKADVFREINSSGKSKNIHVASLATGDAIGLNETGFFSKSAIRTACVISTTPMVLLKIDILDFQNFLKKPSVNYPALKNVSEKIFFMQFMRNSVLLKEFSQQQIQLIANKADRIILEKNSILFQQNDIADKVYYLITGEIMLLTLDGNKENLLTTIKAPCFFGESGFLEKGKRNATAKAKNNCELFVLDGSKIQELMNKKIEQHFYSTLEPLRMKQLRVKKKPDITLIEDEGKFLLKNKNGATMEINHTEAEIWSNIDDNITLEKILEQSSNKKFSLTINDIFQEIVKFNNSGFVDFAMKESVNIRNNGFWWKKLLNKFRWKK